MKMFALTLTLLAASALPFTAASQKPTANTQTTQAQQAAQQPQAPAPETPAQQQISKQAQAVVQDANAAADQLKLYKRIEQDQAQLTQLGQQYQQAAAPAPAPANPVPAAAATKSAK
jgi:hypothetical protein